MFEKVMSMVGGKAEDNGKSKVKILGIRKTGDNGPLRAFVDVELPGGIMVKNFCILRSTMTGSTYVSSPSIRIKDASTGDVHITRLVHLPAGLMSEVRIQALNAWVGMDRP